jgi:hypothetical protein
MAIGPLLLAAGAIPELFKIGAGIGYSAQSRKYAKKKRPAYEIPQAMKDYLAQTKFQAGVAGLPGQGAIEAKLGRQTASAQRAIQQSGQSSASQLAALAAADQSTKESVAELGVEAAQYRAARQNELYSAERAMAQEQKAAWEWDKQMPYLDAMRTAAKLEEYGTAATFGGLEGLAGIAQSGIKMAKKDLGKDGKWFGGGGVGGGGGDKTSGLTDPRLLGIKPIMAPERDDEDMFSGGYDSAGDFNLPTELTSLFNNRMYGTDIPQETQDYYGMHNSFNRMFQSLFRRRGKTYTKDYERRSNRP